MSHRISVGMPVSRKVAAQAMGTITFDSMPPGAIFPK
jgi:hypothetical protein